jgi:hypothetical protein
MGNLFRAVAADRHAAPPAGAAARVIGKCQSAGRALARFYIREVFLAHELRQRFSDRQQQRLGRSPTAHPLELQTAGAFSIAGHDACESFITFEQPV